MEQDAAYLRTAGWCPDRAPARSVGESARIALR
jgi:hypothetical protein